MNKAAQVARTSLLARMDSDDIAEPERLKKEYDILVTGKYDLVFSGYTYIDDKSRPCNDNNPLSKGVSEQELIKRILTKNIIHHPTVMMRKDMFDKTGGYRDYPCAQDLDLWHRMFILGCRFYMIPEPLLKYRISQNSITARKWYQQQLTVYYINKTFVDYLRTGKDAYSKSDYNNFLMKNKYNDINAARRLEVAVSYLKRANTYIKNGNKIIGNLYRILIFLTCSKLRKNFLVNQRKLKLCKVA